MSGLYTCYPFGPSIKCSCDIRGQPASCLPEIDFSMGGRVSSNRDVWDMGRWNEEVFEEEDPIKNCTNYPNNKYETYNDCDRQSALSTLGTEISPAFYPYWAAPDKNFSLVATDPIYLDASSKGNFLHTTYVTGVKTTNCRLSCKTTKTFSKFISNQETFFGSGLYVTFNPDMQVTRTILVKFDPIKCLCDMGGMLGLWLGLGALQLGELLVTTAWVLSQTKTTNIKHNK